MAAQVPQSAQHAYQVTLTGKTQPAALQGSSGPVGSALPALSTTALSAPVLQLAHNAQLVIMWQPVLFAVSPMSSPMVVAVLPALPAVTPALMLQFAPLVVLDGPSFHQEPAARMGLTLTPHLQDVSPARLAVVSAQALQPALSAKQPTPTGKIRLAALLVSMEPVGSVPPALSVTALSVRMLLLVLNA